MKKRTLIVVAMTFIMSLTFAQDYSTGIGVRGGFYNGLTVKHFLGESSAVEAIVATRWAGFDLTLLYELHKDNAFGVDRLNWYYGIGGHVGLWNDSFLPNSTVTGSFIAIGVDAILGLEYNFQEIPINLSIDWKPAFNILGGTRFLGDGGALSLRYIF